MQVQKAKKGHKIVKSLFGKYEEIPEDWEKKSLSQVVDKITDIDHKMPKKVEKGIPFLSVGYLIKNQQIQLEIDSNNKFLEYVSDEDYKFHSKKFNAEKGNLLYTRFGSIGTARIINTDKPLIASYSVVLIKPSSEKINSVYLAYYLNSPRLRTQAKLHTQGSSNQNLHLSDIKNLKIILPTLNEQQKIASILSNVDNLIENNDRVIELTKKLKKGLMQQLLTKGIGHKKFRKIKWFFGKEIEIPQEWEVKKLKDITERVSVGHVGITSRFYCSKTKGIKFLRSQNVRDGKLDLNDLVYILKDFHNELKKSKLQSGDLLIVRVGANRADSCVLPDNFGKCNCANIIFARPKNINTKYLDYFFQSKFCKKLLLNLSVGAAQEVINTTDVQNTFVFIPTLNEQQKIVSILTEINSKIDELEQTKSYLHFMNKGLMQKLLTGEIRVKV